MNNNKALVGKYVKWINDILHKESPNHYPVAGTVGVVVLDVEDNEICVQWPHNTTSADDMWWCFKTDVEIMPEANSENVLRYGNVITDDEVFSYPVECADCIRIRLIEYCGNIYYHKMENGDVVDFKVVGKINV